MTIYIIISLVIFLIAYFITLYANKFKDTEMITIAAGIILLVCIVLDGIIYLVNYNAKTKCEEVWSGQVVSVNHKEEWDEWHPPYDEEVTETDSKGKTHTKIIHHPGYWEHHDAENYIKTTDNGKFYVYNVPTGQKLTDDFVNSDEELEEYYPIGMPTASIHTYTNKVQSSYSIYKHKDIDPSQYNLPNYPKQVNYYCINRYIGDSDNSDKISEKINKINRDLNNTDNPNNVDNIKSYKQINLILVDLGDVSEEYGLALQDYWQNGNKNDFVIAYGSDNDKVKWCYPFSWSEAEDCKYEIKEEMLKEDKDIIDKLDNISDILEEKFERKQFADFNYIQIELSPLALIFMYIVTILGTIYLLTFSKK